jgi:hypothetical protein
MHLTLDDRQQALLRELLDSAYRDLRFEIADTDNSRYKQELRDREVDILALLDLVGGALPDLDPDY